MYNIYMRNYPQADIDITEAWELPLFFSLAQANAFIEDLEKTYADPAWCGHYMYKAKFYAEEVN